MINPQAINFDLLPWVPLDATAGFPAQPGIYFAIDAHGIVQYIGKSKDVRGRWKSHHRYEQLAAIGGIKIVYLFFDSVELLLEVEAALIQWFNPPLNVSRPSTSNFRTEEVHSGGLRNKIKHFLDIRGITCYRFMKDVGIAQGTAYALYDNPDQIPASNVLSKICDAYEVQPGELLEWTPRSDRNV